MNEDIIGSPLRDALVNWEMGVRYVTMVTHIFMLWLRGIGSFGIWAADWWRKGVVTVVHRACLCD